MTKTSSLEALMLMHIRAARLPVSVQQHRFCDRLWRFDFAWPEHKLAVEVHGGTWTNGRHTRGAGFANDREKVNTATLMGWRVLEFTGDMVKKGYALTMIERALVSGREADFITKR